MTAAKAMIARSQIRRLTGRILRSEMLADILTASLLTAGTASGLFRLFELSIPWSSSLLASILISALLLPAARFWRVILLPAVAGIAFLLVFLWQTDQLETISQMLADFLRWSFTWLQIGQPVPENAVWFSALRILIITVNAMFWLPLVRRAGWPLLHAILLAVIFTPLLVAYPAVIENLLISLGGLIMLLPRRFIRQVHREQPDQARLARAPLQFLALPAIILCLILAQAIVPDNTRDWRWPFLVNQINDIGDLIESQSAPIRAYQPFSISAYGFQTEGGRLGGPAVLSHQTVLRVTTDTPALLRATSLSIYTGSSWQRSDSGSFRFGSGLWRMLRLRTFGLDQPDGPVGRSFRNRYLRQGTWLVEPVAAGMATIFTAGRTKALSLADNIDYPPYFNLRSDVYVFGGLPRSMAYTVTSDLFDRSQAGFDEALLAIESDLADGQDENWPVITADYLQLPENLPESVSQTANEAVGKASSPYAKALALDAFFKSGFTYTLTPGQAADPADFVGTFLKSRQGYCVHFATAMVVMARTLGIPARYAEGFVLKRAEDSTSGRNWIAAGNTAHAWAELYFEGLGWLTFDPTPGNSANDPVTPTPIVTPIPSIVPSLTPGVDVTPTPPPGPDGQADSYAVAWWLLLSVSLILLAAMILPRLAIRRHRRLFDPFVVGRRHPDLADRLEFYYNDLLRQLSLLDIRPEPGETLLDFAGRLELRLRLEGLNAAEVLHSVERWRYGAIIPDRSDLEKLARLHSRVEERLQASLGYWSYRWGRVFKAWRVH